MSSSGVSFSYSQPNEAGVFDAVRLTYEACDFNYVRYSGSSTLRIYANNADRRVFFFLFHYAEEHSTLTKTSVFNLPISVIGILIDSEEDMKLHRECITALTA